MCYNRVYERQQWQRGMYVFCVRDFLIKSRISGLVVEYIVAIDVTRVRFPADACIHVLVRII